jgi:heavy metal sensor kinase
LDFLRWIRPRNVRHRLTLWHIGVFGFLLILYISGAALLQFWQLSSQLYHAEVQDMETVEGLLYFTPDGRISLHQEYYNHPQDRLLLDRLMEILTPEGEVLYRSEKLRNRSLGATPLPNEGLSSYDRRDLRLADGTRVLRISHVHSIDGKPLLIRLAYDTAPLAHSMVEFALLLLAALPLTLVFAGFIEYRMVLQTLKPLENMVRRTEQITADRLSERLPVENAEDELGQMAGVLNNLLQRLEDSFEHLKHFTSDASHELRTLLASLRSVGEVGLQREHTPGEYRDVIGSMLEEVTRLTRLVEALLAMAVADAGQTELKISVFPLMDLVHVVVNLLGVLAEDKRQTIRVEGHAQAAVSADRMILQRAVVNLVENAIKYSPPGGTLRLLVTTGTDAEAGNWTELLIEDEGPGIPDQVRGRIFERFFRFEHPDSHRDGGAGLGLAIAKWAVEVNGGEINVRSGRIGCLFSIRLPRAKVPASPDAVTR